MTHKTQDKDKQNTTQKIKQIWTIPTPPKPGCISEGREGKTFVTCIDFYSLWHFVSPSFIHFAILKRVWKYSRCYCGCWLCKVVYEMYLFSLTSILSLVKLNFRVTVTKPPPGVVWIIRRFWKKKICSSTYIHDPFPRVITI